MPFKALLTHLICLGEDEPQVTAYGLEEEVDYSAPAFRFEALDENLWNTYSQLRETQYQRNYYMGVTITKNRQTDKNQIHRYHQKI
ncbi:sugar phosphate isomerase [Escherichia coli]|nr:sugar phosphate isomerase [Escherichia coli]